MSLDLTSMQSSEISVLKWTFFFNVLQVLSFVFPAHFQDEAILTHLISFLEIDEDEIPPLILSILSHVGKYKPIGKAFDLCWNHLLP